MANYGRDTGERYNIVGDILKSAVPTILTGLIGVIGTTVLKNSEKQNIQSQIADCDRRINEYRSGFLGSWLNSDQIETEKNKRAELQSKYKKI